MASITEAELLDALAASMGGVGPLEARTVAEMHQDTGLSAGKIKQALQQAMREGRLQAHRVARRSIDGAQRIVPAYTITPAKKAKRA